MKAIDAQIKNMTKKAVKFYVMIKNSIFAQL